MSDRIQAGMVRSRVGRVILHMVAMYRDGKVLWHWRGIEREIFI